jgi:malonyl CoA-acyl carrier protein transacylase
MIASTNESTGLLFAGQGTDVQKTVIKLTTGSCAQVRVTHHLTTRVLLPFAIFTMYTIMRLFKMPIKETKDLFGKASAVLGYDLLDVCLHQPDKLKATAYSQLAVLVTSLATVAKAKATKKASR